MPDSNKRSKNYKLSRQETVYSKIIFLLVLCIISIASSTMTTFIVYFYTRDIVKTISENTIPCIIASEKINVSLASAHCNAINAVITNEKTESNYWTLYRNNINNIHSELLDISKNTSYDNKQQELILSIMSTLGVYEYKAGCFVSNDTILSSNEFTNADKLMQQQILPDSISLININSYKLDSVYNNYTKKFYIKTTTILCLGFLIIVVLIETQIYIYKKTNRILNVGLLLATLLFLISTAYSIYSLTSIKAALYEAKQDSFDSIHCLWNAKDAAYNSKTLESLYLLHHKTGITQTIDTMNFNTLSSSLYNENSKSGYLTDNLNNTTFSNQESLKETIIQNWETYITIDKQIHTLEDENDHNNAVALCIGTSQGQSEYAFKNFNESLDNIIDINQTNFNNYISSAYKILNIFPIIIIIFTILMFIFVILGLKPRIDEYMI